MLATLFQNYDQFKLQADQPVALYLSIIFGFAFLIAITLRKTEPQKPLSIIQTNQMKGIAIIMVVIQHFYQYVIKDPFDPLAIGQFGYLVGVSVFLILSAFGLSISIEKKGTNNFFSKRLIRVYLPFVLAMLLEVTLNYIFNQQPQDLTHNIGGVLGLVYLDRNMWFINFILFWYLILYIISNLGISNKYKLIALISISIIFIANPKTSVLWNHNAFTFPFGYWLGIKSKYIIDKIDSYATKNITMVSIILTCFLLGFINMYFVEHVNIGILFYILFTLGAVFIFKEKINFSSFSNLNSKFESISIIYIVSVVYIAYFGWFNRFDIIKNIFYSSSCLFNGITVIALFCWIYKWNIYSKFLEFFGKISFELYLLHGMFMYSYDFILFRGNIIITFFVYLGFISLVSLLFNKFNSTILQYSGHRTATSGQ